MKKILIIITAIVLFSACTKERTTGVLKEEIKEYNEKIKELQTKLSESDTIDITGKVVNVRVQEASFKKTTHSFTITGGVQAEQFAYVTPEMNGRIKKIFVKEGVSVRKGQLLASLNSNVIKSTIAEVETGLELAKTVYLKQKKLWEQKVGKEIDYLQAKNNKESLDAKLQTLNAQLEMSEIKAPFSGIVDEIYLKEGEMASPGKQLIDLVNINNLEVEAYASEKYISSLVKGGAVTISFPAYPDIKVESVIDRTGNIINLANRTFKIKVKFKNIGNKIKPNMLADILLSDYEGNNITVPSLIIKNDRKGEYIFVAKKINGKMKAQKIYIKTGLHTGELTIIENGVKSGDNIIVEGYNTVKNGTLIEF